MTSIVIFDSGVGGLSVFEQVAASLPKADYVLVCDNLEFPYGDKSEQCLNQRVLNVMQRIVEQFKPDLAVVACNTASTIVLPLLRESFHIPIVGVVPAVKPASERSLSREFGLLATPATVARSYTQSLLNQFASDCTVMKVGSSRLVEIAETKLYGGTVDMQALEAELRPFLQNPNCDVLVLACTHFPLLNKEISSIFEDNNHAIELIDSGSGIARRVVQLLHHQKMPNVTISSHAQFAKAVFTAPVDGQLAFIRTLQEYGLEYAGSLND